MLVEASPVVPCKEDRAAAPVGSAHHRVDEARHVRLANSDRRGWMLAGLRVRNDPGDRRKRSGGGGLVEAIHGLDVAQLVVLLDGLEAGQGIPDLRSPHLLGPGVAEHLVVGAVGLGTGGHIVRPAHTRSVKQVRDVRPREGIGSGGPQLPGVPRSLADGGRAAHRVRRSARGRPSRHHGEVRRKAPGADGLEHVILENEVLRIAPIIRDLSGVVPAHRIGLSLSARVLGAEWTERGDVNVERTNLFLNDHGC